MSTPMMSYMHSFSVTENHIVLYMNNVEFSQTCVLNSLKSDWTGVSGCFSWKDENKETAVMVVNMNTGKIAKIAKAENAFVLHHANAYEEGEEIVLDMCTYENSSILKETFFNNNKLKNITLRDEFRERFTPPAFKRLRIPMETKQTASDGDSDAQILFDEIHPRDEKGNNRGFDFPLVNPRYKGKKYCFIYGLSTPFSGNSKRYSAAAWVKMNVCELGKEPVIYFDGPTIFPNGDAQFIPNPNGVNEDDGVILTVIMDGSSGETQLAVIDAKTMKSVATVAIKDRRLRRELKMPNGIHSIWVGEN